MTFDAWLRSLGIDPDTLSGCQRRAFERHWQLGRQAGRDAGAVYYRDATLTIRRVDGEADDSRLREIIVSTDAAIDWGGWREVLTHTPDSIDTATLRAVLLNHDPDWIVGPVRSVRVVDGQLRAQVEIYGEARMQSGVLVERAIDDGSLRGISVGYTYGPEDVTWDDDSRTLTAARWRALEASLTPIPADPDGQVRSVPPAVAQSHPTRTQKNQARPGRQEQTMNFSQWLEARGLDPATLTRAQYQALMADYRAACQRDSVDAVVDVDEPAEAPPAGPDEGPRARQLALQHQVRDLAETAGVRLTHAEIEGIADWAAGRALVERKVTEAAQQRGGTPGLDLGAPNGTGGVRVTADAADKFRHAATAGLIRQAGLGITVERHGAEVASYAQRGSISSISAMVRLCAEAEGIAGARHWDPSQCASYVIAHMGEVQRAAHEMSIGVRDAANQTAGMFTTLLASATTKVLMDAFDQFDDVTYDRWCTIGEVPDFKTSKNTGLAAGNLVETAENHAFPELLLEDGGYDSALAMWGATVSLTFQALANDDIGSFMKKLAQAGFISRRTIERQVFYKLLNATWTNDVTTSAGLGTAGNLDKTIAALRGKLDMAGNKMGIQPKFLIHDPITRQKARQDCGIVIAPGQTTVASVAIEPIESPWVGDTGLYASAVTTDYYLAGDPRIYDTVKVEFLRGMTAPIVAPFDPGAVAAQKVKIMLPFQATVATHTDSASNARVTGMQHASA